MTNHFDDLPQSPIEEPTPEPIPSLEEIEQRKVLISQAERKVSRQKKEFLKVTRPKSLTLLRQFELAGQFGRGNVQSRARNLREAKRQVRLDFLPDFSFFQGRIKQAKSKIGEEEFDTRLINIPSNILDLSMFSEDRLKVRRTKRRVRRK